MPRVIVVGGGPAGMIAAITAAENGNDVTIIEKNKRGKLDKISNLPQSKKV